MLRKIILATAVAGALSISAFAACGGGMGMGMSGDKGGACGMEKGAKGKMGKQKGCGEMKGGGCCGGVMSLATVKLSTEQKAKIDSINEEFRSEMAKLHIKDKPMMKDPFAVAGGFDKEAFKKERADKMQKHLDMKADHLAKTWAVLTPEQQKSIAALAK
jgi:Spy/CpxP family protein refolding chaperone